MSDIETIAIPLGSAAPALRLPRDHPQRLDLSDEVHARPPPLLHAPAKLSYLALYSDWTLRDAHLRQLEALTKRYNMRKPSRGASHYAEDFGPFRLTWERHTEFTRYTFIVTDPALKDFAADPFAEPAISHVPADWLQAIPGEIMVAAHGALVPGRGEKLDFDDLAMRIFNGNNLIGASISDGVAYALTDFRIHHDGFSRFWMEDRGMGAAQAGRIMQRLFEIDTYRVMALLALPAARELGPILHQNQSELTEISTALIDARDEDESALLDRLTRLQAEIDSRHAKSQDRFSAAAAYYELVQRRIEELREGRVSGLQSFREFTERRLAPAMNTVSSTAARMDALSIQVSRATQLLSTRVDIARQQQNSLLLNSMNRRFQLQLRLQETVEALSVAAVTYYVVALVGYAARSIRAAGIMVDPDLVMGISIPIVAISVLLAVRKVRRMVQRDIAG